MVVIAKKGTFRFRKKTPGHPPPWVEGYPYFEPKSVFWAKCDDFDPFQLILDQIRGLLPPKRRIYSGKREIGQKSMPL